MNHIPVIKLTSPNEGTCFVSVNKIQYVSDAQGATKAQAKLVFHGGVELFVKETAFHVHTLIGNASRENH